MRKRFSRSSFDRFLGNQPSKDETTGSHAYGKVSRSTPVPPRVHRTRPEYRGTVANYRDSMVGSTVQYRDKITMPAPKAPEGVAKAIGNEVIGNRPKSGTPEKVDGIGQGNRRHHFVEPPKRNFNRFD